MKFPSIRAVARELRSIYADAVTATDSGDSTAADDNDGSTIDVRLQVQASGAWGLQWGDPSYDTNHRGFWGASSVPARRRRWSSIAVARDLIAQCRDDHAQSCDTEAK